MRYSQIKSTESSNRHWRGDHLFAAVNKFLAQFFSWFVVRRLDFPFLRASALGGQRWQRELEQNHSASAGRKNCFHGGQFTSRQTRPSPGFDFAPQMAAFFNSATHDGSLSATTAAQASTRASQGFARNLLAPPEFEIMNREINFFMSEEIMRQFCAILIVVGCALAFAARAQDTNALKTEIGIFESQTGVVVIKGFAQIGSVSTGSAVVSVRCKESASAATSHKDYGIAVVFEANEWRGLAIVDYDELDALLNGMDYLGKMTYGVTALPGFEAAFTTKSGLQLIAFGNKQQGGIRTFLQYNDGPRIPLASDQWTQLANLIGQAKTTLDSLRATR